MWKFSRRFLIFTLLLVVMTTNTALAIHDAQAASGMPAIASQPSISPGTRFSARERSLHTINMQQVAPLRDTDTPQTAPLLKPFISTGSDLDTQSLQEAAKNKHIPVSRVSYADPVTTKQPATTRHFPGLAQTCCQPSDVALAASPQWVVEAVNLQIAIYQPDGTLQSGWPRSLPHFFGIPAAACTKTPFVTAPRASYDANEQRFWVVALEDEGLTNSCPSKSLLWVAVSQTNNPNGNWHIYTFNMASHTHAVARFTQFALDQQAIYFSANMYSASGKGPFQYSELFASRKAPLQAGQSNITYYGFVGQRVGNRPVDTVQPVQVQENTSAWLHGGLFVNSFNLHYGGGRCVQSCSGIVVWSLTHPGQANDVLTGTIVHSLKYALAPLADQPGCMHCFARQSPPDTRISATPIYHHGLLSFALVTAINNQKTIVPGILWGQIAPILHDNGTIARATMYQDGYFHFAHDEAALFPSVAVNNAGDLFLLYDYTGSKLRPGVALAMRRVTYQHGRFHDGGVSLRMGNTSTVNAYWGNYTATSYAGPGTDKIWFAGQFSNTHHHWETYLARS